MVLQQLASWDCGCESNRGHRCLSFVNVVCCPVEISASSRSIVQWSPTESNVPECDRESSIIRKRWNTGGC